MDDTFTVAIEADTGGFETAIQSLEKQAKGLGDTLVKALESAVVSGKSFEDVLRQIGLQMAKSFLSEGLQPLQGMLNNLGSSLFSAVPFASGGIVTSGGVVAAPSYFPLANGKTGLMGEAGPEAIMPLTRGADGRLGIAASIQDSAAAAPVVHVTINTPDALSFRRSEAQVTGAIARAVSRGQRTN